MQTPDPDRLILEKTVPSHMLVLMMEKCAAKGFVARQDAVVHLNQAAVLPLASLDAFSVRRLAKRTDMMAKSLLSKLAPDDPCDGLYCCAMFVLQLVDEGLWTDTHHQAVLYSLLFVEDARHDTPDEQGERAVMKLNERRWQNKAHDMMVTARLLGLYQTSRNQCN